MYWFKFYVFFNVLILTMLALNVSKVRNEEKVPNGDGGKVSLKKAIRSHANGVEHVMAFGLLILALAADTSPVILATLVIGFTISRVVHAAGMLNTSAMLRVSAASVTYLAEVAGLVILGSSLIN